MDTQETKQDWRTGNTWARKEQAGRNLSMYLTPEQKAIVEERLRLAGVDPTPKSIDAEARALLREAIAREGRRQKKSTKSKDPDDTYAA